MLKNNIMYKFMLLFIPAILIIYIGMFLYLQKSMYENAVDSVEKLSVEAQTYTMNLVQKEGSADFLSENASLVASYLSKRFDMRVQIFKNKNKLLTDTQKGELSLIERDVDEAVAGKKAYLLKSNNETPQIYFSSPVYLNGKVIGIIRFIHDLNKEYQMLKDITIAFIFIFLIVILIAIIFIKKIAQSICNPIENLRKMSYKMTHGDYKVDVGVYEHQEIQKLAYDFSVMANAIEFHVSQLEQEKLKQKEFVDQLTHELKTPITSILGYIELIPKISSQHQQKECFYYINKEGKRLLNLVEETLESSKYGTTEFQLSPAIINISDLIKDTLFIMKLKITRYHITVINKMSYLNVVADYDKTKQIFLNLFDNIVKYSDASQINIEVDHIDEEYVTIIVKDNGIGMDQLTLEAWNNRKENLFQRLPSQLGNGLGLLLCSEIMQKQGGDMKIISDEEEGTTIYLSFYVPAQLKKMKTF
ncbi:HAMP domain-containing sensor histidine kinase [Bacillus changyiensis]|uniref:HAMP domain-containing sensor histidine kinase n=1 Tax=Bacillus changyiensis TaxID=3004103 RepID=UPI0022E7F0AB|nr:HAMP domain-containing sensor histidine kinase [Bacillus changyiensis]MDA1477917.1 HAMP domain-containing sensor histidine kinase [Bacillus changyiensis]